KPKQKINVFFEVTFNTDCVPDPDKTTKTAPGQEDFSYTAHVNHAALDGNADSHTLDDNCPHAPLPDGIDLNPNPAKPIKDKGCGNKVPGTTNFGAPVLTDVVVKE